MQRVLELALFEEPIPDLAHLARDLERGFGLLTDVLAVYRVLVLRIVFVHIAVARRGLVQRGVVLRELPAVHNDARLDGHVPARGLGVLDRAHDRLAADDLAEDDVLAVEVRRWDGGDEELGAVGVWACVCLSITVR